MAATNSSASSGAICLDSDGDLTLVVGSDLSDNPTEFLICCRTLSRASYVFKAMLYGNFKESRPADPSRPWIVTLPDDDPSATMVLLNIIHSRFHHAPNRLGLATTLYALLVFADKYDMTKLLQPWLQGWVSVLPTMESLRTSPGIWPAIAIARELGSQETVCHLLERLIRESKYDSKGNILVSSLPDNRSIEIPIRIAGLPLAPSERQISCRPRLFQRSSPCQEAQSLEG